MKNVKIVLVAMLAIVSLGAFSPPVMAQVQPAPELYTKQSKDTCKNQDTVIIGFDAMYSGVKSLTATVKKLTGTIVPTGSWVDLQGRTVNDWNNIDSMNVLNQSVTEKVFESRLETFYDYRLWMKTAASTQTSVLSISYVRRPGSK